MRHRRAGIKLNRTVSHRKAMFRNMVTSLFKYDRIRTTDAKAKEIRRWADQLVTLAKRGDLHARRQAMSIIREKEVVHKLFEDAPKRFADVNGGYTRVVKIGFRPGDAASVSLVELVTPEPKKKKKPRRKKKAAPVAETQSAAVTETAETKAPDADVSVEAAAVDEAVEDTAETQAPSEASPEDAPVATVEEPEAAEKKEDK
ncbi:MAG: 50S ribosomal protein L17 [Desulfobacteraceae bacterium]|nr:50S ribosomal protein L17 [Desulfobacteraceae bacterium]MBC2748872.1 50S ribosomal protein L17 [Desulfobacteraceae bacterium]